MKEKSSKNTVTKITLRDHKERRHKKSERKLISTPKIDNASKTKENRTFNVVPCFSGKTNLMMNKIQSTELNNSDRKLKNSTRSPNKYPVYDIEEEVTVTDDSVGCLVSLHAKLKKHMTVCQCDGGQSDYAFQVTLPNRNTIILH